MPQTFLAELAVKLYADGANQQDMLALYQQPFVKGFTTNPSLMRKAGIKNYQAFALDILKLIPDRPISFEVFADDLSEMESQAKTIASWGENVFVKIPVMNTKGESTTPIIKTLSQAGIALNVTAIFTLTQVQAVASVLSKAAPAIVSVFAGRIADTGVDPLPIMQVALQILQTLPKAELLWASPRELFNIIQAHEIGCHIITLSPDLLNRLYLFGKDLTLFSQETVQMFYQDACQSGYEIQQLEQAV